MHRERDPWTDVSPEVCDEARELAGEVIRRMLVWTADAPTMLDRGLRATVALHCLRPDRIANARPRWRSGSANSAIRPCAGERVQVADGRQRTTMSKECQPHHPNPIPPVSSRTS